MIFVIFDASEPIEASAHPHVDDFWLQNATGKR